VARKDRELKATVLLPADAESYRVQTIAEGERTNTVEVAKAQAERIKMLGAAEAASMGGIGKAEAEKMRLKAQVYRKYGKPAVTAMVVEALPKIAAEIAAPLAKTGEIVILGGDGGFGITDEVTRLAGQVPPAIKAISGVDLSQVFRKIPGAV